jgi:transposase
MSPNIATTTMTAQAVISAYHDLWQVERSFRMAKTDLRARPVFHHQRDSIEAHLTIVFAALAISSPAARPGDQTMVLSAPLAS